MRPSVALDLKRSTVREATSRFCAANPRVFGSVLLKQLPAVQQDVVDEERSDDHSGDKSC